MVKPFSASDVLPETDSMYVKIPVKNNTDMCGVLFDSYISGLTEKNRTELLERAEYIYASVDFENNNINAAIVGNFPFFIDMVFTQKNGWNTQSFKQDGKTIKYYVNSAGFQVAVLQDEVILVSSTDIQLLLKRQIAYESAATVKNSENLKDDITPDELSRQENVTLTGVQSKKVVLASNSSDIMFYTTQAGTFIEGIIGNGITLAAENAAGSFKKEQGGSYILDMNMSFKDKHAVKPALFLFKKSQLSNNIETEALSDMSIRCTGMSMDINTIISLIIGG